MGIREVSDKQMWENFVTAQEERTFLNSWNWGEFQKSLGVKIWRLGIFDNANSSLSAFESDRTKKQTMENGILLAVALVVKIEARRGNFLFCPHGPMLISDFRFQISNLQIKIQKEQILKVLTEYLRNLAKEEKCSFIRWNSLFENTDENNQIFRELGFRKAPIHIHPEETWVLDVAKADDDLLKGMRKTARYLVRKSLTDPNIQIEIVKNPNTEKLRIFYEMYLDLAKRQRFTPFSFNYIKCEFEQFSENNSIALFLGSASGKILAGAMVVYWGGMGFYHHGASYSMDSNKTPVTYRLQWEAMCEAKKRGCAWYNFWGIAPNTTIDTGQLTIDKKHPWYGLTLFKTGFGGEKREYVKTQDLPLNWKYWVNVAVEKLRAAKRGY